MSADWWAFWDPAYGYRRDAWLGEYQRERAARPLKPGKTRRAPISNTRRVLHWIAKAAMPARCLETNIYAAPSETAATLEEQRRMTAPFDFLVRTVRPRVILAHGDDAIEHLGRLTRTTLTRGGRKRARHSGATTYGWWPSPISAGLEADEDGRGSAQPSLGRG